jgi:hypothetical protein
VRVAVAVSTMSDGSVAIDLDSIAEPSPEQAWEATGSADGMNPFP